MVRFARLIHRRVRAFGRTYGPRRLRRHLRLTRLPRKVVGRHTATAFQLLRQQSSKAFDAKSASKYLDTMRDGAENQATTALAAATGNTDPEIGLRAVSVLRGLVETLEALQVDNARAKGWSWQQIATLLGLTKQAVHHKHGPHAKGRDVPRRPPP